MAAQNAEWNRGAVYSARLIAVFQNAGAWT